MLELNGQRLSLEQVELVARGEERVALGADARARVAASRGAVERILEEGRVVYGVNTGFGKLSEVTVPREQLRELQLNLVRSHACGLGEALPADETRAMMLLRANVLALGLSGARPVVVETLIEMLNRGVLPVIPEQGSVGASGDLAPLAHLALACVGEGEAFYEGEALSGGEALRRAGLEPLRLEAKEGLALLNGTQALTAVGALALARAD
ncbi:MAG TPA: aromatic amino acid lyase, partial [Pyrinomonadaceae bacterium]